MAENLPKNGKMMDRGVLKDYKLCASCQRPFTRRKKWNDENRWKEVKYCSDSCRRNSKKSQQSLT